MERCGVGFIRKRGYAAVIHPRDYSFLNAAYSRSSCVAQPLQKSQWRL